MAKLHKFNYEKNLIPKIGNEEILRRAKLVFPCTVDEGNNIVLMKNYGHPIKQSFSWGYEVDKELGKISYEGISKRDRPAPLGGWYCKLIAEKIGEFLTLHEFAYYGFFKPSIGEIVSQLPSELFDEEKLAGRKIYITNKMISDDVNTAMLNQTWHIAKTLGFRRNCNKINFSTNVFFMQFKNEIAAIGQLSYIGLPLRKNVASSRRYGVEFEYNYKPINSLVFSGNGTYMKANIDSYTSDFDSITYNNVTPLLTPEWIFNQSVSYSFLKDKVTLSTSARYISTQFLGNDNNKNLMIPEFFTLNSTISIRPTNKISISLICNNITNKINFNSGYAILGTSYYYIAAPRNYYITFNYKF